jgi:hypothetical protein
MNLLKVDFTSMPHPYPEERSSHFENWGIIRLWVADETGRSIFEVFRIQWDINPFVKWIKKNEYQLRHEQLQLPGRQAASIAKTLFDFYESADPDDDRMLDQIFEYRTHHDLRFAIRGVDLKEIYLGKGPNGYEISHFDGIDNWCYQDLQIDGFLDTARKG